MNIKTYIETEGLTFEVLPTGKPEQALKVHRGDKSMETKVTLSTGVFDGERFVAVLKRSLKDIEVAEGLGLVRPEEQASARASLDALGQAGRVQFFKVRDDFKSLVGQLAYRRLIDDVEA